MLAQCDPINLMQYIMSAFMLFWLDYSTFLLSLPSDCLQASMNQKPDMWCQYSMSWTGCLSMPVLTIRWFTLLLLSAWPCSKISVSVINTSSNHLRSAHVNLLYVSNEICLAAAFFSLSSTSVWNALSPSLRTCTTFMVSSLALRPNFLKLL